ncbi:hypothetical protein Pan181_24150 [Aeoliella mucimassa]|uniref:Uncharacterized protein n=2 Tax=Aeoliella mucimassa TaxID=2527972 RepID=A0A518ANA0_9BACT|nr:hypothetical protein Pan181_24150 [Aeoliella mucimassa]
MADAGYLRMRGRWHRKPDGGGNLRHFTCHAPKQPIADKWRLATELGVGPVDRRVCSADMSKRLFGHKDAE